MTDQLVPVRFAEGSDDIVEGLGVPFGGPFPGDVDAYRTRFDKADLHLDWYDSRPILYHHGQNPGPKLEVIGRVRTADITDYDENGVRGKWIKGELDKSSKWHAEVSQLVKDGALGWSHGTVNYLMDAEPPARDGTRNITQWPIAEFTLTPLEASPFYAAAAMRSMPDAVWEILGTTEDEFALRGWLPEGTSQGDLDDGDFAWTASDKSLPDSAARKLPYKIHGKVNEAGWKAAWSRAHQDGTDFAGGPSQADVIKKLLADAPAGVDTKYDDGKEAPPRSAEPGAVIDTPPARAGARNSAQDQGHLDTAHQAAHLAVTHTFAIGAKCDTCSADGQGGDDAAADGNPDDNSSATPDDDAAPAGRSADLEPVFTVTSDVDPAVRASAIELARQIGRDAAANLRR